MTELVEYLVLNFGYLIVFVGALFEGELIITVSCVYAAQGMMNINAIFIITFVCSIITDQVCFILGRKFRKPITEKYCSERIRALIDKALVFAINNITMYTLVFRFIPGIRTVSPFIIGMTEVNRWYFTVLNIIAAFSWSSVICTIGYRLGKTHSITTILMFLIGFIILTLLLKYIVMKFLNKKKN